MTWWRLETLNASEDVQDFEDIQGYLAFKHVKQASPEVSYRQRSPGDSDASLRRRACLQQWERSAWFQATWLKTVCERNWHLTGVLHVI